MLNPIVILTEMQRIANHYKLIVPILWKVINSSFKKWGNKKLPTQLSLKSLKRRTRQVWNQGGANSNCKKIYFCKCFKSWKSLLSNEMSKTYLSCSISCNNSTLSNETMHRKQRKSKKRKRECTKKMWCATMNNLKKRVSSHHHLMQTNSKAT